MQIPGLAGLDPGTVLKRALKEFLDHEMLTQASALAYQALFSLFPFILFLVSLLSFLHLPNFFDWLRSQTEVLLPPQATDQVNRVIGELQQPQGGLLSVGMALALWAASAGVRSIMNALNVAYEVAESRPPWKRYGLSLLYTLGLAALLILAAGLMTRVLPVGVRDAVWCSWVRFFPGILILLGETKSDRSTTPS